MLTTNDAAALLGVTRRQVGNLIQRGTIHAQKHGRDWLIPEDEIERYKVERRDPGRPGKGRTMNLSSIENLAETTRQFGSLDVDAWFEVEQMLAGVRAGVRADREYFGEDAITQKTLDLASAAIERCARALDGAANSHAAQWELGYPGSIQRMSDHFSQLVADARASISTTVVR